MSRNIRAQQIRKRNKQPGVWFSTESQNKKVKLSLAGLNIAFTMITELQGIHIPRQSCRIRKGRAAGSFLDRKEGFDSL